MSRSEEFENSEEEETSPAQALPPEWVADYIVWFASSTPEFVLTEGIITPTEESSRSSAYRLCSEGG